MTSPEYSAVNRIYQPIQNKRALESTWNRLNPVLMEGEMGIEKDTSRFKIGDGVSTWKQLKYFTPGAGERLRAHILSEDPHPNYDDGSSLVLLYENSKAGL
jgi:Major tropism determinant N-terminal domain